MGTSVAPMYWLLLLCAFLLGSSSQQMEPREKSFVFRARSLPDCRQIMDAAKEVQVDDPCAFTSVPLRQLLQVVRPPEWPFFAPEELPEESAELQLIKRFKQICRSAGCIWHSGKKSPESSGSRMGCDAPEARDEPPCGSARGRGVCRCESSSPVGLCDATVVMRECCCERAMTDA